MKKELIELRVNGRRHELAIEPSKLLLDVLRQDLGLTGSKRGCDDSSCGACTVLVDGVPMMSCTLLGASCEGQEITTVEGVAEHGALAAIQKAYGDWGGAQCGYCTPGFMMTVKALLAANPDPTEDEIRHALSGNLCRCTGYTQMYQAVKAAIEAEQKGTDCHQKRMRCRSIFAAGIVVLLVCSSKAAEPTPPGWRRPTAAEVSEPWRNKSATRFLTVRADLDGDGKQDTAELLVSSDGHKYGLWVRATLATNGNWQLVESATGSLAEIGISKVSPGKYETACGKGYGDYACEHGEPDVLRLSRPAIDLFYRESADIYFYWDSGKKQFVKVQMSD